MTWKHDIQLGDLDGDLRIEVTCRRCGYSHYERISELLEGAGQKGQKGQKGMTPDAYLDEVEARLACKRRRCRGAVRITLTDDGEASGFVGGLP